MQTARGGSTDSIETEEEGVIRETKQTENML